MAFQDVLSKFKEALGAQQSAAETLKSLQAEIARCQHEINVLAMRPPTREDVAAMLTVWVKGKAAEFQTEAAERLLRFAADARALENPRLVEVFVTLVDESDQSRFADAESRKAAINKALCAAMPQQMTEVLVASLARIAWPEGAVAMGQRRKRTAELEKRMHELQAQEAALVATMDQAMELLRK